MITSSVSMITGSCVSQMALHASKWSIAVAVAVPALCVAVRKAACQSRSGRRPRRRAPWAGPRRKRPALTPARRCGAGTTTARAARRLVRTLKIVCGQSNWGKGPVGGRHARHLPSSAIFFGHGAGRLQLPAPRPPRGGGGSVGAALAGGYDGPRGPRAPPREMHFFHTFLSLIFHRTSTKSF